MVQLEDVVAHAAVAEDDDQPEPEIPEITFEFTGTPLGYFRVWIVSLSLTLVTCGIFSAWSKVRRLRYIYSHLLIDGTPLEYRGRPIPILKGRLIALSLAAIWYCVRRAFPLFQPLVFVCAGLIAPVFIARSAAFRARSTAYRNITLNYDGQTWALAKKIYAGIMVTLVTLGFGYAFLERNVRAYLVNHTSYGCVHGTFTASGNRFLAIYFKSALLFMLLLVPVSILLAASLGPRLMSHASGLAVAGYLMWIVVLAYRKARTTNLVWRSTDLGGLTFNCDVEFGYLLKLYAVNALAIVLSGGFLIPWAVIRTLHYRVKKMSLGLEGSFDQFRGSTGSDVRAVGAEVAELFDLDFAL